MRQWRMGMAFLALALSLAGPARAADLATLGCVAERIDSETIAAGEADVARNLAESGKRPSYAPAFTEGLRKAAAACAGEHGWSPAALRPAGVYALAKLGLPLAERAVAERGFDAAALEERFQALPEEVRSRPLATETLQRLIRESVLDEALQTRENAELLGEFFGFLSAAQYAASEFDQA